MEFEIFVALSLAIVSIIMVFFAFTYQRMDKKYIRYISEEQRSQLSYIRDLYEKNIYDLTKKMSSTDENWRDLYHIMLSSQKDIEEQKEKKGTPKLTGFLKDMGITEKDLIVDDKLIFVLTPFHMKYRGVFESIRNICNSYGFHCLRGDEEFIKGDIFSKLLKKIVQARLIIVNIEGRNPNVLYELGISHALDKPVILISKSIEKLPFDIKSKSIIIYDNLKDLDKKLRDTLFKLFLDIRKKE